MVGKVTLSQQKHSIFFVRTPEELQALRDADAKAGRFIDDGGEPILYGPYSGWTGAHADKLVVTNVRARSITWLGWGRRPKGLRAAFSKALGREVLFIER